MYSDADNPALKQLEEFAAERRAFWADPPRGQCKDPAGCLETDAILYLAADEIERCSRHHALLVERKPEGGYPCDNCGEGPAFRDPEHRRDEYLCPRCHLKYDSYEPGERAMIFKTRARIGVTNPRGLKPLCVARGQGTDCHGQVKPRGGDLKGRSLCDFHADPAGYLRRRQS